MSIGGLFFIVFGLGMFLIVRYSFKRDKELRDAGYYEYDEEYENEQDELDDDEIAYFVSEGWKPEDGPPEGWPPFGR